MKSLMFATVVGVAFSALADISKLTVKGKACAIKDAMARKLGGTDNPVRLPFCVEKDGVRYSCDIADDAEGIDWKISRT